jgi:hypothetical protein
LQALPPPSNHFPREVIYLLRKPLLGGVKVARFTGAAKPPAGRVIMGAWGRIMGWAI